MKAARGHTVLREVRGITLSEVALVVGIIGLAVTLALPHYRGLLRDQKISRVTENLVGLLRFAQQSAIGNSVDACGYRVIVGTTNIEVYRVASSGAAAVCASPESLTLVRQSDQFQSEVSAAVTTLQFTSAGRLTAGSNVDIVVTAGDRTRTVRVHYLTGSVEVAP